MEGYRRVKIHYTTHCARLAVHSIGSYEVGQQNSSNSYVSCVDLSTTSLRLGVSIIRSDAAASGSMWLGK